MICGDYFFEEESNERKSEKDIGEKMNIKEINDVSNVKSEEVDENEKFNLPLTLENQNNLVKKENNQFSLYKEFEEKWNKIERNKINNLKKKKDSYDCKNNNTKSNNSTFYSLSTFQNWKGIIDENRKKFNERKLKENKNEFEIYINDKMKKIKSITKYNSFNNNKSYRKKNYYEDRNRNYIVFKDNHYDNSIDKKSFLKNYDESKNSNKSIFDKINYFRKTQEKIPMINLKESKLKKKMQNVFGIITHNKELINNKLNSKYSDLSINELKKNFDEIMGNLSNNYKEKNRIAITRSFKKQNLDNFNSFNNENLSQGKTRNLIEKKLFENKMLLNDLLPESGVGNKKGYTFNKKGNNKKLSSSFSLNIKNNNKINPIRISNVYGINDFQSISKKCDKINSPTITKLIYY